MNFEKTLFCLKNLSCAKTYVYRFYQKSWVFSSCPEIIYYIFIIFIQTNNSKGTMQVYKAKLFYFDRIIFCLWTLFTDWLCNLQWLRVKKLHSCGFGRRSDIPRAHLHSAHTFWYLIQCTPEIKTILSDLCQGQIRLYVVEKKSKLTSFWDF